MKTIIITPMKGLMKAPGIAVTVKDDKNAYLNVKHPYSRPLVKKISLLKINIFFIRFFLIP